MTRVATPANESTLLNVALYGTAAHVERLARLYRRVERIEENERAGRQHRDRYLQIDYDDDGSMLIHARLPAEVGAVVKQAIEAAMAARPGAGPAGPASAAAPAKANGSAETLGSRRRPTGTSAHATAAPNVSAETSCQSSMPRMASRSRGRPAGTASAWTTESRSKPCSGSGGQVSASSPTYCGWLLLNMSRTMSHVPSGWRR